MPRGRRPDVVGGSVVRVVVFVALIVLSLVVVIGGLMLIVVGGPRAQGPALLLGTTGAVLITGTLIVMGSMQAWWDPAASGGSRRQFRRVTWILLGLQVVGGALLIVWTVAVGAAWWAAPALTAAGAVLDVLVLRLGPRIRAWNLRTLPETPVTGIPRTEIASRIRWMLIAFLVTLAAGGAVAASVSLLVGPGDFPWDAWLFPIALACYAGAFAGLLTSVRWGRRLRAMTEGDLERGRRWGRAVRGRTDVPIDDAERPALARYAATLAVLLPFQAAYFGFLYAGIALGQAVQLVDHPRDPIPWILVGGLIVAAAVLFPLTLRQARRARRYATEHEADLAAV